MLFWQNYFEFLSQIQSGKPAGVMRTCRAFALSVFAPVRLLRREALFSVPTVQGMTGVFPAYSKAYLGNEEPAHRKVWPR